MLKGIIHETEKRAQVHTHCRFQGLSKPKTLFFGKRYEYSELVGTRRGKSACEWGAEWENNAEEQRETSLRLGPSPSLSELEIRKMSKAVGSMKK